MNINKAGASLLCSTGLLEYYHFLKYLKSFLKLKKESLSRAEFSFKFSFQMLLKSVIDTFYIVCLQPNALDLFHTHKEGTA
jgi:hypothetical protein